MTAELVWAVDTAFALDDYVHRSAVTFSMLGKCRRQAAYALRDGWPEEQADSSPQAYLGSAIHEKLLRDIAVQLGGQYEQRVELNIAGLTIAGTADLLLPDRVVDLKTTSDRWFGVISARTPHSHRLQVTGYALAAGVPNCTLLYVNRSDGDRFLVEWQTEDYAHHLLDWVEACKYPPELVPRDERGPGLSMVCDSCPFKTQCWGPTDNDRTPQAILADELGNEVVLSEYDEVRERMKQAKSEQELWRAALDETPPGTYGDWQISWSGGKPKQVTDVEMAEAMLLAAGIPIPKKTVRGSRSINVKRRKPGSAEVEPGPRPNQLPT